MLNQIPCDLMLMVLDYLPLGSLYNMALTSKQLAGYVDTYVNHFPSSHPDISVAKCCYYGTYSCKVPTKLLARYVSNPLNFHTLAQYHLKLHHIHCLLYGYGTTVLLRIAVRNDNLDFVQYYLRSQPFAPIKLLRWALRANAYSILEYICPKYSLLSIIACVDYAPTPESLALCYMDRDIQLHQIVPRILTHFPKHRIIFLIKTAVLCYKQWTAWDIYQRLKTICGSRRTLHEVCQLAFPVYFWRMFGNEVCMRFLKDKLQCVAVIIANHIPKLSREVFELACDLNCGHFVEYALENHREQRRSVLRKTLYDAVRRNRLIQVRLLVAAATKLECPHLIHQWNRCCIKVARSRRILNILHNYREHDCNCCSLNG